MIDLHLALRYQRGMRHSSALLLLLAPLAILSAPRDAEAGGCSACTSSQMCRDLLQVADALCVMYPTDSPCQSTNQYCCPGQGCAINGGRPSCEASGDCVVVGETDGGGVPLPQDASVTDTGRGDGSGTGDGGRNDGGDAGRIDAGDAGRVDAGDAGPPGDGGPSDGSIGDSGRPDARTSTRTGGNNNGGMVERPSDCGCSAANARDGAGAVALWLLLIGMVRLARRGSKR